MNNMTIQKQEPQKLLFDLTKELRLSKKNLCCKNSSFYHRPNQGGGSSRKSGLFFVIIARKLTIHNLNLNVNMKHIQST